MSNDATLTTGDVLQDLVNDYITQKQTLLLQVKKGVLQFPNGARPFQVRIGAGGSIMDIKVC